jgi:hypothetical protein
MQPDIYRHEDNRFAAVLGNGETFMDVIGLPTLGM